MHIRGSYFPDCHDILESEGRKVGADNRAERKHQCSSHALRIQFEDCASCAEVVRRDTRRVLGQKTSGWILEKVMFPWSPNWSFRRNHHRVPFEAPAKRELSFTFCFFCTTFALYKMSHCDLEEQKESDVLSEFADTEICGSYNFLVGSGITGVFSFNYLRLEMYPQVNTGFFNIP